MPEPVKVEEEVVLAAMKFSSSTKMIIDLYILIGYTAASVHTLMNFI
jgi:hypothetical protein